MAYNVEHIRRQGFEIQKFVYSRKFNRNTKAESLHFCPAFVYVLLAVVLFCHTKLNCKIWNYVIFQRLGLVIVKMKNLAKNTLKSNVAVAESPLQRNVMKLVNLFAVYHYVITVSILYTKMAQMVVLGLINNDLQKE